MNERTILESIREIEIVVDQLYHSRLIGNRQGLQKGIGNEFEEFRDYIPGHDDAKYIDWLASAKIPDRIVVDEYLQDQQLNIVFLLDSSNSIFFGRKWELALKSFASLSFSALKEDDRIGAITFSDEVNDVYLPKTGRDYFYIILKDLLDLNSGNTTNLCAPIQELKNLNLDTDLICYLSDFPVGQLTTEFGDFIQGITMERDFLPVIIEPEYEKLFRELRGCVVKLQDSELGKQKNIFFGGAGLNIAKNKFSEDIEARKDFFLDKGFDYVTVNNDHFLDPLVQFFLRRRVKR